MFTGIIRYIGRVKKIECGKISISAPVSARIGQSVAVNGVCLTVVSNKGRYKNFDLSDETLLVTNLGLANEGSYVNIELPLKAGDDISGHIVTGHIDCTGSAEIKRSVLKVKYPKTFFKLLPSKCSVAVDGVSLTVNSSKPGLFTCQLIPHTLNNTTFKLQKDKFKVNLEFDVISKYIIHAMSKRKNT